MATNDAYQIAWKQIGTGYLICLCVLGAMAFAVLGGTQSEPWATTVAFIALAVLYGLVKILTPVARWFFGTAETRPDLQASLKWWAVMALCALSLATSAAAVVISRQLNP